jgi:hypothetical protein
VIFALILERGPEEIPGLGSRLVRWVAQAASGRAAVTEVFCVTRARLGGQR